MREKKNAHIEDHVEAPAPADSAEPAVPGKVNIVKRESQLGNYMEDNTLVAEKQAESQSQAVDVGDEKKKVSHFFILFFSCQENT